jgi:hypothetical protein
MAQIPEINEDLFDEVFRVREQVYRLGYSDGFAEGVKRTLEAFQTGTFADLKPKEPAQRKNAAGELQVVKKTPRKREFKQRRTPEMLEGLVLGVLKETRRPATIHDFLSQHPDIANATALNAFQRLERKNVISASSDGTYTLVEPGIEHNPEEPT